MNCVERDGATIIGLDEGVDVAFVDAEWLRASSGGRLRAIGVTADGVARWYDACGGYEELDLPVGASTDTAGHGVLAGFAARARQIVAEAGGTVEVIGTGAVAQAIAHAVGTTAGLRVESPRTIVDTTGKADVLVDATQRLPELGTFVLAGPPPSANVTIDLYPDVHVRGLRLVGVGTPEVAAAADAPDVDDPARVRAGEPVPVGASWYRVER